MDKFTKAISAAATILKAASDEVSRFVQKNTPESALLAALVADYAAYQNGLPVTQALLAAFGAFMTFAISETYKDSKVPQILG